MRIPRPWTAIAYGATATIVVLCFLPAGSLPQPDAMPSDKLQHGLAFLVVGFAWRAAGLRLGPTLLLGVCLAAGTELGQILMIRGRHGDPLDFAADLLGLLLGMLAFRLMLRAG